MELRAYWRIIWRRMWVIVAIVAVVLVVSVAVRSDPPPLYRATLRFIVGVPPEPVRGDYYTYDRYYSWLASEYLADDFSEVVKSADFAGRVTDRLNESGTPLQVPPGAIQGATVAEKQHRILSVHLSWGNAAELERIAAAVEGVLQEESAVYFSQLGQDEAKIYLVDPAVVTAVPPSLRQRLDLPIRLALALLAGLFLAFLIDYLDDAVRDVQEVESLGLPVLGTLPPLSRRMWPLSRWQRLP